MKIPGTLSGGGLQIQNGTKKRHRPLCFSPAYHVGLAKHHENASKGIFGSAGI